MSLEDEKQPYAFRAYLNDDIPFIMSSWGKSFYSGRDFKRFLSPQEFSSLHKAVRESFFKRPSSTVIVCCFEKDPSLILGWLAVEKIKRGIILHYIYVKEAFKKEGIASNLMKNSLPIRPVYYTHLTERAAHLIDLNKEKYTDFIYEPKLNYGEVS